MSIGNPITEWEVLKSMIRVLPWLMILQLDLNHRLAYLHLYQNYMVSK